MTVTEKVAYVKGLMKGLDLDESTAEVKILSAIVDLLDDVSANVSELDSGYDDLADQIDTVDEDLHSLEEDFYGDADDEVFYEVTCPSCNETVCVTEPIILDGGIECPNCKEYLEFDLDCLCDGDDCGCHGDKNAVVCKCEPECSC